MAIPSSQDLKLPLLKLSANGTEFDTLTAMKMIAEHLGLSESQQAELLPSGNETVFRNRTQWAVYELYRAGLFERPKRGYYRITQRGHDVLAKNPDRIDHKYLKRFPEYREFLQPSQAQNKTSGSHNINDHADDEDLRENETPDERLERAYNDLKEAIVMELREQLSTVSPFRFERIVLDVLVAMGYGGPEEAAQVTQRSNDKGIDGTIKEDSLGLDTIYVQAKRWRENIGRKEIQSFVGSLEGHRAHKGVFITTSSFADTARQYADGVSKRIILIDGHRLAQLMVDFNVGVTVMRSYQVKRLDSDYFTDE